MQSPAHVRFMGKGQKERISPMWPETADLIAALLRRQPRPQDQPVFLNRYGEPLTASGFRFRLHSTRKLRPSTCRRSDKSALRLMYSVTMSAAGLCRAMSDVMRAQSRIAGSRADETRPIARHSFGRGQRLFRKPSRRSLGSSAPAGLPMMSSWQGLCL